MKKLYLTKKEKDNLWNYVGDPLNSCTTLDVGLVEISDESEIKVNEFGAYVERYLTNK